MLPIDKLEQTGLSLNTFSYVHLSYRIEISRLSSRPFPLSPSCCSPWDEDSRDTVHGADEHRLPRDWELWSLSRICFLFILKKLALLVKKILPCGSHSKESSCNVGDLGLMSLRRREWIPTPVFLPGDFHGRCVWRVTVHGVAELDRLSKFHFTEKKRWGLLQRVSTGLDLQA